jgi:hypothetical protein
MNAPSINNFTDGLNKLADNHGFIIVQTAIAICNANIGSRGEFLGGAVHETPSMDITLRLIPKLYEDDEDTENIKDPPIKEDPQRLDRYQILKGKNL